MEFMRASVLYSYFPIKAKKGRKKKRSDITLQHYIKSQVQSTVTRFVITPALFGSQFIIHGFLLVTENTINS